MLSDPRVAVVVENLDQTLYGGTMTLTKITCEDCGEEYETTVRIGIPPQPIRAVPGLPKTSVPTIQIAIYRHRNRGYWYIRNCRIHYQRLRLIMDAALNAVGIARIVGLGVKYVCRGIRYDLFAARC